MMSLSNHQPNGPVGAGEQLLEDNVMEDVVLTVEEAAHYLKVSEVTIRRWCADGKLPAFKIGREWRINKSQLDKMMQSNVEGAWSENAK